jgi:hypothetical protein
MTDEEYDSLIAYRDRLWQKWKKKHNDRVYAKYAAISNKLREEYRVRVEQGREPESIKSILLRMWPYIEKLKKEN